MELQEKGTKKGLTADMFFDSYEFMGYVAGYVDTLRNDKHGSYISACAEKVGGNFPRAIAQTMPQMKENLYLDVGKDPHDLVLFKMSAVFACSVVNKSK